jgi:omega-6 fatty acid desaturase (delta-12 desaturase)
MENEFVISKCKQPSALLNWKSIVAKYQTPDVWRSSWQVANTLVPYLILWYLMYRSLAVSYWITLGLAILAAGFLARVFIIFHDCGHGSFFKSWKANDLLGFITGVLTFTPYYHWRWQHAIHHASAGDLDRRGAGDVWTLTVDEFLKSSWQRRFAYRLIRHPAFLLVIAPLFLFLIQQRFPASKARKRERLSVYWTNLAIMGVAFLASSIFGLKAYLIIQFAVVMVTSAAGVWLFYVQHQFEGVYWQRSGEWDYLTAALQGSSFYKLPKVLQWFTGNIGFHHIHHLQPQIPNYRLEKCHKADPLFQTVKPVTLFASLKSFTFRLWDEPRQRLVGFGYLRTLKKQQRQASRG